VATDIGTKEASPIYNSAGQLNGKLTVGDIASAPKKANQSSKLDHNLYEKYTELLAKHSEIAEEALELKSELSALRRQNKTADILDTLIVPYAGKTYLFMVFYCLAVGVLVASSGYKWGAYSFFSLEESTLNFLVGSTATAVVGLVGMVLTGIFIGARK
jgi:hypothetical protein